MLSVGARRYLRWLADGPEPFRGAWTILGRPDADGPPEEWTHLRFWRRKDGRLQRISVPKAVIAETRPYRQGWGLSDAGRAALRKEGE